MPRKVRTAGKLRTEGDWFVVEAEPHIRLRLKSLFPKIAKHQYAEIDVRISPESARDLEWFMTRFPLDVDEETAAEIERLAGVHDERMDAVAAILAGTYEPPEFTQMAKPPRPYQSDAAALALTNGGLLVGDEIGLGKTVTALTMLSDPRTLPALVVVPTHIQRQWAEKVCEFTPHLRPHIIKKSSPYHLGDLLTEIPDVLIITYHKLSGWAEVLGDLIKSIVYDECQDLRRRGSLKYAAASHLSNSVEFRMGLSATPIYNYGEEFWSVVELLSPGALGARDEFIREWCVGAYSSKERLQDPVAFGSYLRESGLMLRRTRTEVGRQLPSLNRVVHEIDSDTKELDKIEDAAAELAKIVLGAGSGFEKLRAAQGLSHQLRQATGIAKAPFVAEFVRMLLEDSDDPVLLFGWHRAVYELWAALLSDFRPVWYTGSESPTQKAKSVEEFLSGRSKVMMMSLRSGSGVDGLQDVCSRVVVGELDWSPGALEQCIGRVHRDGQEAPVFAYYLTATEGADPVMVDVLGLKAAQIDGVREPHGEMTIPKEVDPDHVKKLAKAYLKKVGRNVRRFVPEKDGDE